MERVWLTPGSDRGVAIIIVMLATLLMSALGAALMLSTASETLIAGSFRTAAEAQHAADAVLGLAVSELGDAPWDLALSGAARSNLTDGSPVGSRRLANGVAVNLTEVINRANCQQTSACADGDLTAVTSERPWGARNPRWRLFAYGPLATLGPAALGACCYVVAMIADDPSDDDGDPFLDGTAPTNPGAGVLVVRAEAFGPRASHAVRSATVSRRGGSLRTLSWRNGPVP